MQTDAGYVHVLPQKKDFVSINDHVYRDPALTLPFNDNDRASYKLKNAHNRSFVVRIDRNGLVYASQPCPAQ